MKTTIPNFPDAIPLTALRQTHCDYDPLAMDRSDDLYDGAAGNFKKNIERYLVKTELESMGGISGKAMEMGRFNPKSSGAAMDFKNDLLGNDNFITGGQQYEMKKKCAWYAPEISGVIDFMLAAMFQNPVNVIAVENSGQKESIVNNIGTSIKRFLGKADPASKTFYWSQFNNNADGNGRSYSSILSELLFESMKHRRSYLLIKFPGLDGAVTAAQQKTDARVQVLNARIVDDWSINPQTGAIDFLRCHYQSFERSSPWVQPDLTRDTWIYFTANATYKYDLVYKSDEPPDPATTTVRGLKTPHELGKLPIVPLHIRKGLWIMGRLSDICIALFNRQCAATWSLNSMAYAPMVVYSDQRGGSSKTISPLTGMYLDEKARVEYPSPPPSIFDAQQKDIERLETELFLCLQSMVLLASARDTQGRASGIAKKRDFSALNTLLGAYAAPVLDAARAAVDLISEARDEQDITIAINGCDDYDVQSLETALANADNFLALPGAPETAKRQVLTDLSLKICGGASGETREAIIEEIQAEPAEKLVPPAPVDPFSKPAAAPIAKPEDAAKAA
jgi:hypothetical protein